MSVLVVLQGVDAQAPDPVSINTVDGSRMDQTVAVRKLIERLGDVPGDEARGTEDQW